MKGEADPSPPSLSHQISPSALAPWTKSSETSLAMSISPDDALCVICSTVLPDTRFLPCGHVVACDLCATILRTYNAPDAPPCPCCRVLVTSSVRIAAPRPIRPQAEFPCRVRLIFEDTDTVVKFADLPFGGASALGGIFKTLCATVSEKFFPGVPVGREQLRVRFMDPGSLSWADVDDDETLGLAVAMWRHELGRNGGADPGNVPTLRITRLPGPVPPVPAPAPKACGSSPLPPSATAGCAYSGTIRVDIFPTPGFSSDSGDSGDSTSTSFSVASGSGPAPPTCTPPQLTPLAPRRARTPNSDAGDSGGSSPGLEPCRSLTVGSNVVLARGWDLVKGAPGGCLVPGRNHGRIVGGSPAAGFDVIWLAGHSAGAGAGGAPSAWRYDSAALCPDGSPDAAPQDLAVGTQVTWAADDR